MKFILLISSIFILNSSFLIGQNNIDLNSLPDIENYTVVRTNPDADTVVIALHGGPTDMLYPGDFDFFEGIPSFSVIEMKQYQHQNPQILANTAMTLDEAIIYGDTCVALLKKLVNHYNNLNKTVVIIGHSFGAFIIGEYVDDYGIEDLHKIIPMAGRLNMNEEIWNAFADGYGGGFSNDGLTPIVPSQLDDPSSWATMKLMAGYGYNRWVDSLATLDLTNLMYAYGEYDQAVGRLLADELDVLNVTGASVLMVPQGGHGSMFALPYMNQMLNFIRETDAVSSINEGIFVEAEVNIYPTMVNDNLTVDSKKNGFITISNIEGRLVFQKPIQSGIQNFALNNLTSGFYIATFTTIDHEKKTQKLIVK